MSALLFALLSAVDYTRVRAAVGPCYTHGRYCCLVLEVSHMVVKSHACCLTRLIVRLPSTQRLNLDSPGVVRRTVSKPISIIRSTSVPAQLQDRSQGGDPDAGGGSGGKTTNRRGLHIRDRSLQHGFNTGGAGGFNGIVQSLPPPQAPLLAGSLPPSRFLDDLPPLCLGPQVCWR